MRLIPRNDDLGWTPYAWTVYVVFYAISPMFARNATPIDWLTTIGTTLIFLALYFRGYWVRGPRIIPIMAALVLLGLLLYPHNSAAGVFFIYAASFASRLDHDRAAIATIAGIEVIVSVEALLTQMHLFTIAWVVVFVALVGAINVHFEGVGRQQAKLRLAHDEIEHLAKVAERERIARDLHDLLGHTLSVIILKSELASKLAERDPERAREEIRDVERIAREALAEVRSAVTGYRSGGLQSELQRARSALATAGVALDCATLPQYTLPPSHEAVLCLALREAVTNIVRHSGARRCRITIRVTESACTMSVFDDGRGGNAPFGSGLTGMRERMEVLGGTLTRDGRHGTTLNVTLPMPAAREQERTA